MSVPSDLAFSVQRVICLIGISKGI